MDKVAIVVTFEKDRKEYILAWLRERIVEDPPIIADFLTILYQKVRETK